MAEQEGFVAVFPQGTTDQAGTSHWNANLGISTTNDHGFLGGFGRTPPRIIQPQRRLHLLMRHVQRRLHELFSRL